MAFPRFSLPANQEFRIINVVDGFEPGYSCHCLQATARREPPIAFIAVEGFFDEIHPREIRLIKHGDLRIGIVIGGLEVARTSAYNTGKIHGIRANGSHLFQGV